MANTIVIKHRTGSTGEPSLTTGEIATNIFDKRIYIGAGGTNLVFPDKTYVDTEIANLVNSAPSTLDTLNELATALGNDPNYATTITNALASKAPLASPALTGTPTAPTATTGTNTTQLATTAFVNNSISAAGGYTGWTVSDGTNSENIASTDSVTIVGSGATTVSYNTATNQMTVNSVNTTYSALSEFSNDTNFITASGVTFENLSANGDIGSGASQVSAGNHNHDGVYEPADASILKSDEAEVVTANWSFQGATDFVGALTKNGINVLTVNSTIDGGTY